MQQEDISRISGSSSEAETLALSTSDPAVLLQQVLDQRSKKAPMTHKEYGLGSVHGREMIKIAALREHETEISQVHQQIRFLQSQVRYLEEELAAHREKIKEYEHTIERLSAQNANAENRSKPSPGITGRPSMDTRLLKSFLHGSSQPSHTRSTTGNSRNDSPDGETDLARFTARPCPNKIPQVEARPRGSASTEDVLQGYADDLRTVTTEKERLRQALSSAHEMKTQVVKHKREIQRLKLRCSIAESESVTLKAQVQGMEPADLDVFANPILRREVEKSFEANDKLESENEELRRLLSEALPALPAECPLLDEIRAIIHIRDDGDAVG